MTKFESIFLAMQNAVKRLREVLEQPKNDFMRDSAIKRFEFCFDLSWKTLKAYLEENHNVQCLSPKTCFREAYNKSIISEYDNFWLKLADLRNESVHTYNQELAEKLYMALPEALVKFESLLENLKKPI